MINLWLINFKSWHLFYVSLYDGGEQPFEHENHVNINKTGRVLVVLSVAYPGILFGGVQQIQLTEDRENGDLGAVAP
jgi:hypothetical protein